MDALSMLEEPGLYVISDTLICDGTGPFLQIMKQLGEKVLLISSSPYAHYKALFRKFSLNATFLEVEMNFDCSELPLTEDSPDSWSEAQHTANLEKLWRKVKKLGSDWDAIAIDNIYTLNLVKGEKWTMSLINSLKGVSRSVILKISDKPKLFEELSDVYIDLRELATGFSTEYTGKLTIKKRNFFVKEEIGPFWFVIKENQFKILD